MAANKELLTDILDGITVLQVFLCRDLKQESLSPSCETQRQNASMILIEMLDKIHNTHPSIRPRMNTPGNMKKPPPPLPPSSEAPPPISRKENEGEELYEEAESQPVVEDYLDFEPSPINGSEHQQQEMYEAMTPGEDHEQDVYEEPVIVAGGGGGGGGGQQDVAVEEENYEEPMARNNSQLSFSSLASKSQENSGSGAEYAETIFKPPPLPESQDNNGFDISTDWGNVYTMPSKGNSKTKPSALKNVLIKGYLEKLGGKNRKTWQRRYCVLSGPLMYFYEKESSKSYNNCIAVPSFTIELAENVTNEKKKLFGFMLSQIDSSTGKKKDYYFRSSSNEVREKWINSVVKLLNSNVDQSSHPPSSFTLPRMPSQHTSSIILEGTRKRTSSLGAEIEEEGELYEDMAIAEEEEGENGVIGDYVPISPTEGNKIELESSEEYVDVVKQEGDIDLEEYEDTSNFQHPPPPLSPPPGPPSDVFTSPPTTHPSIPPKALPPPPPEPEVDTTRVYTQSIDEDGIQLHKVFVSLWDFAAGDKDELNLHRGDLVYVNTPLDSDDWWFGELLNSEASAKLGQVGLFPRNYSTTAFEQVTC